MNIYVFDRCLSQLGVIDNYNSLIWTRKTVTNGTFQLQCSLTADNLELLSKGNIICKSNDLTECAYIENRNISLDDTGMEILRVTGKFITGYLTQRIIWGMYTLNMTSENAMRKLVDSQCINTSNDRKIPLLKLGEVKNYLEKVDYQVSYANLSEELENLCNTSDLNYKIVTDLENKIHTFEVFKGVDRTVNQSINSPCIFCEEFENISDSEYTDNTDNYKNTVLIAGEGEGQNRQLQTIGNTNKNLDRFELFVDARDLQSTDENENVIPLTEYKKLLTQRGEEALSEYKKVETFESNINVNSNLKYKEDFDLGDYVTCHNKKWNVTIDCKITEIEEVYEESGMQVNVNFGEHIPTILDKLKAKMR